MIEGTVNDRGEVRFPLVIADSKGASMAIMAMFDTGFNGSLTLPPSLIKSLGLVPTGDIDVVLADGVNRKLHLYSTVVALDNLIREIDVDELDGEPLAGMELFAGFHITIDVVPNGRVTFEQITSTV